MKGNADVSIIIIGDCDIPETCDGVSVNCPANMYKSGDVVCRAAAAGGCDVAENCTGFSHSYVRFFPPLLPLTPLNRCPDNEFVPSTVVCRNAAGVCDLPAHCSGSEYVPFRFTFTLLG